MAENYKHLYEQMKKMLAMYQDEIVPGMREQLENRVEVVRCKDCEHCLFDDRLDFADCWTHGGHVGREDFCSYGERRTDV